MKMNEDLIPMLSEMRRYYAECAENAMPGSRAERKFTGYYAALDQAIARLSQEPEKPKVSEWLEDSDPGQEYGTTWACRNCLHSIHKPFVWDPYSNRYKYCPHCGARMAVKLDD